MIRIFLFLFAAAGLVGIGAASALFLAPERIAIVVGADSATQREAPPPPPRDRTDELLQEIGSLREGLVALGGALDAAAAERESNNSDVAAIGLRLGELADRHAVFAAETERRWESLRASMTAASGPPPAPVIEAPAPAPEPVATAVVSPPADPVPAAPKRRTLAELLAARKNTDPRDSATLWRLMPQHGRVGFDGRSTIHNFTARSDRATGAVTLNLRDLNSGAEGDITLDFRTLASGVEGRDEAIHEHLGEGGSTAVSCSVLALRPTGEERDGAQAAVARLRFGIHGHTHELEAPVTLTFTRERLLRIQGEAKLKMSDFEIKPQAKLGVIRVEDEVTVWWDLYAEPQRAKS